MPGVVDPSLCGEYDYTRGGSMEKYTQGCTLNPDGSAFYTEFQETRTEAWTRSGHGTWNIDGETVWIIADLKKDTKIKSGVTGALVPGIKDEVKVDRNVYVDIKADQLRKAPPSSAAGPKSRWLKKM
eukprot:TRINITY_DN66_c0_g1_i2.p1 TRINITY_DN66_c0_g1~~TRINITY_DN66_c0_g1_i2.p1  ORF type:complete len:127 (+),score=49.52 TRINITY_DN66_c0_g1_i2:151-531(+)